MRSSQSRTWRLIGLTAMMAAICWIASIAMVRALAQTVDTNEAEETERRTPSPRLTEDELPEYRDSADNNISMPVDI